MNASQVHRLWWRSGFFALFLLAPALDIFRLDLYLGHFIFFGQDWTLDVQNVDASEAVFNVITRAFLPLISVIGFGVWLSWRFGRIYCGWLCPHFSVVETINSLMRRASGRPTLWLREPLPTQQSDGQHIEPTEAWWPLVFAGVLFFSLLWAITLLTYLLPPSVIWVNIFNAELSRNQFTFIAVATVLLTIEFAFARHLFCRFGCAIGIFQSLVWMANDRAQAVVFDRKRARFCADCDKSCEHACPMRLVNSIGQRNTLSL